MERSLEELADTYLDGLLSREEARAFERDLAERPEVAAALNSALVLRELLLSMPPLGAPAGLEERIARSLALAVEPPEKRALLPRFQAALAGLSWSVKGPVAVLETVGTAQPVAAGLGQARWVLGTLRDSRRTKAQPKPLWQRALAFTWRRLV